MRNDKKYETFIKNIYTSFVAWPIDWQTDRLTDKNSKVALLLKEYNTVRVYVHK